MHALRRLPRDRHRAATFALAATLSVAVAGCTAVDPVSDAQQTRRGLAAIKGVPQDGFTLGRRDAPWTLNIISSPTSYELDDLITVMPMLTDQFVRGGRLKLEMRTPTKGPYGANGEERAVAGVLLAAGLQDRYWNALVRFVPSYTGGVTTSDLTALLRSAGVPDIARAMSDRATHRIRAALDRADLIGTSVRGDGHLVYILTDTKGNGVDLSRQAQKGRLPNTIAQEINSHT
jgi:hypothetical protein